MLIQTLRKLFVRDLEKLEKEIEEYRLEENIWKTAEGITNSGGNLCLHLIGNLNTYIGAELGKTGYIRHRELEFSLKDIPKKDLLLKIKETIGIIEKTLDKLPEEQLEKEYPIPVFDGRPTTGYFLVHLATHLAYHLGQINYHRRLLDK